MVSGSKKRRSLSEDSSSYVSKKIKTTGSTKKAGEKVISASGLKDAEGNEYWEIADKKRITISEFRGKRMISIREYYEKEGQMLPGKKGISLPLTQFSAVVSLLPHIESILEKKGDHLPRPDYSGALSVNNENDQDDESQEQADEKEKKRNFEETSEEDS